MSLDLLTQYIDHALTFERLADAEPKVSGPTLSVKPVPIGGSPRSAPEGSACLCPVNQSDIALEAAVTLSKGCEDRLLLSCDWHCRDGTFIAPAFNR
jgi:hypothetical protein